MLNHLSQSALELAMINQEPGSLPGEGLTALQTFTYFVALPIGLFLGISFLSWITSGEKRVRKSAPSVITTIE
jgi:hypothetical protein